MILMIFEIFLFTHFWVPGDPDASGPILSDPVRFRAFRAHLGRPRHQGKQKNDLGTKNDF